MTRAGMVERLSDIGYTKVAARQIINDIIRVIVEALAEGDDVSLNGLGEFSVKTRKPQTVHNVKNGEMIELPECKIIHFHAFNKMKRTINNGYHPEDWE